MAKPCVLVVSDPCVYRSDRVLHGRVQRNHYAAVLDSKWVLDRRDDSSLIQNKEDLDHAYTSVYSKVLLE